MKERWPFSQGYTQEQEIRKPGTHLHTHIFASPWKAVGRRALLPGSEHGVTRTCALGPGDWVCTWIHCLLAAI